MAATPHTLEDVSAGKDGPAEERPLDPAGFRLAAFAALLVVVLFAGYGIGRLNNSTEAATAQPAATGGTSMPGGMSMPVNESQPHTHNGDGTVTAAGTTTMNMGAAVGGLSLSSGGLTLAPDGAAFETGRTRHFTFRITTASGAPITTFAVVHDKPLHLIVVRRDLTGFQHLHPTMAPDGTWGVDLTLPAPGSYRAIADFTAVVGGQQIATTLGTDLTVAGDYRPVALPAPAQQATTDNFSVTYEGRPRVESTQPLLMTVTGPDRTPAALEPYLGAYGHLVVLRDGDVGYLHVHPEPQLTDGKVKFWLAAPGPGRYRMFFDFQVAGTVHTAAWSLTVS
jgi:hypothetical protein